MLYMLPFEEYQNKLLNVKLLIKMIFLIIYQEGQKKTMYLIKLKYEL